MGSKLLLNICCGPCGLPIIEDISNSGKKREITFFFYAPNIYPQAEYNKRLDAAKRAASAFGVEIIEGEYDYLGWLAFVKANLSRSPEEYPENDARCLACFSYRIMTTAEYAKRNGFNSFGMTLSINRFKNTEFINLFSETIAQDMKIRYDRFSLDPHKAHEYGTRLAKELNVYRQRYCGCEFSLSKGS